jgi:hypothetical protein
MKAGGVKPQNLIDYERRTKEIKKLCWDGKKF